LSKIHS